MRGSWRWAPLLSKSIERNWMRWPRQLTLLAAHGAILLTRGVLRWRLETFGLYMPSLPHSRPWWRVNGRMLRMLVQHRRRYAAWLIEMRALRRDGTAGWWKSVLGARYRTWEDTLHSANAAATGDEPEDTLTPRRRDDTAPGSAGYH
jgi:hypothetical protein